MGQLRFEPETPPRNKNIAKNYATAFGPFLCLRFEPIGLYTHCLWRMFGYYLQLGHDCFSRNIHRFETCAAAAGHVGLLRMYVFCYIKARIRL
jgi:hypothetical protein